MKDNLRQPSDRRRLASSHLPPIGEIVRGSIFTRRLRCGKPSCRCARGKPHTATYLAVSFAGGRREQISLPAELVPLARRWVANYAKWWKAMETISAANRARLRQHRGALAKRKAAKR